MFSIYILTHNEELDIAACIESALYSDDVIVVDSFSTDNTIRIATEYPVRIAQHRFESHGKQRTWMLNNIPTKYKWIYILEADERMTPELFQECLETIKEPQHIGYYVAEKVIFMGHWIRYSTQYPNYQMRLFRKDAVWFNDYGHAEQEVCKGSTGFLQENYPHFTCGKGLSRWLDKYNRYSTDEAAETIKQREFNSVNWQALFFGKNEVEKRRALKSLSLHLPCRPLLRFIYMYLFLGGILDGKPGFTWCVLQAFYEFMITLKVWELNQNFSTSCLVSKKNSPLEFTQLKITNQKQKVTA